MSSWRHQHLVGRGARLVELRLDYVRTKVNLQRLIENRPCPVVIAIRREQDGGRFKQDEEARQVMLRSAIVAGVGVRGPGRGYCGQDSPLR